MHDYESIKAWLKSKNGPPPFIGAGIGTLFPGFGSLLPVPGAFRWAIDMASKREQDNLKTITTYGKPLFRPDTVWVEEASEFNADTYAALLGRASSVTRRSPKAYTHTFKYSGGWDEWIQPYDPLADIIAMADMFGHFFLYSEREREIDRTLVECWFGKATLAINDNFGMQTEIEDDRAFYNKNNSRASTVRQGLERALQKKTQNDNESAHVRLLHKGDGDGKKRGTGLGYGIAFEASGSLTRESAWVRSHPEDATRRYREKADGLRAWRSAKPGRSSGSR